MKLVGKVESIAIPPHGANIDTPNTITIHFPEAEVMYDKIRVRNYGNFKLGDEVKLEVKLS